jgi:hypothetical protein
MRLVAWGVTALMEQVAVTARDLWIFVSPERLLERRFET